MAGHAQSYIVARPSQIPTLVREVERRLAGGTPVSVTIGSRPSRSREQNAYLHVAIRQLARHLGMGEVELKELIKAEFGPETIVRAGNLCGVVKKSMSAYTKAEASDMIEHVERLAAECGLLLYCEEPVVIR